MSETISVEEGVELAGGKVELAKLYFPGSLTRQEMAAWKRVQESRYYLVRNRSGDTGERYRCGRCSGEHIERGYKVIDPIYHEYFTCMCVDRPWRGLDRALWGYASFTQNEEVASKLVRWAPGIVKAHPATFGPLAPDDSTSDLIAVAIGTLEPITKAYAEQLAQRINQRRPEAPFEL